MNTVEHIVESYFRLCEDCFTYTDVKVVDGNNRQMDILAISLEKKQQFHIECSVTHRLKWCPTSAKLVTEFRKKFSGIPTEKAGLNTDSSKGKKYSVAIAKTYRRLGLDGRNIKRIWICWEVQDPENLEDCLNAYRIETGEDVAVISFKKVILPKLMEAVTTANYDDEVLRTFSLIKQWKKQSASVCHDGN